MLRNFRDSLTDPERIKKATKAYHGEYEKTAKKSNADKIAAIKQLNKVKVQIDRIVTTIIDTGASKAMSAKLKDAETERAQLEERVRLLSADKVVTMHPNVIKRTSRASTSCTRRSPQARTSPRKPRPRSAM